MLEHQQKTESELIKEVVDARNGIHSSQIYLRRMDALKPQKYN